MSRINAAIRMTFEGEDPIAIHSVIAAGHRIIKDICEQRGDIESYLRFTDWIAPGHERDFWNAMNASANFIKHADKDPEGIHELDDEANGMKRRSSQKSSGEPSAGNLHAGFCLGRRVQEVTLAR